MKRHLTSQSPNANHTGVTLVEVLMALMIMSIGVSAVAVLFPISALRSIQASHLTNGAIVKYNVETLVENNPELIFDPDLDGNIVEHFRAPLARNYVVDPIGFYTRTFDDFPITAFANQFGNDGDPSGPNPVGVFRYGGGLRCADGQGAVSADHRRALMLKARAFAGQGDGWDTLLDNPSLGVVTNSAGGAVGIQLSLDLDLTDIPTSRLTLPPDTNTGRYLIADPENYRIVLFSGGGKFSQALPLVHIDTTTNVAYFTEDINDNFPTPRFEPVEDVNMNGVSDVRQLPNEFVVNGVDRVLLQARRVSDYSWMLNVRRRGDGQARSVDVVVRFNNGISLSDERAFEAVFVASTATTASRSAWVKLPADGAIPNIRKGKFIFDAQNAIWYRIQDVREKPLVGGATIWNDFDYLVLLEEPIGVRDGAGSLTGPTYAPAMFPTGIVDVYPIGSRNLPDSLQPSAF